MTKYFLMDCETGGMPEKNTSLLTMDGSLLDNNLNVVDEISLKVMPDDGVFLVQPKAMEINKIDLLKHLDEALPESEAATVFVDFVTRHNIGHQKIIPIGHNVSFDVAFMKKLVGARAWRKLFAKKVIDTASIAEFLCLTSVLPDSEEVDCSLGGLAERFDFSYAGAHDAKFDKELTLKVLKRLMSLVERESKN